MPVYVPAGSERLGCAVAPTKTYRLPEPLSVADVAPLPGVKSVPEPAEFVLLRRADQPLNLGDDDGERVLVHDGVAVAELARHLDLDRAA